MERRKSCVGQGVAEADFGFGASFVSWERDVVDRRLNRLSVETRYEAKPLEHLGVAVTGVEQEEVSAVRSGRDDVPPLGLTLLRGNHVLREDGNAGSMMRVANQIFAFRQTKEAVFRKPLVHGFVRLHGAWRFFVFGGS